MARTPDGLVIIAEPDELGVEMRLKEARELVMCKNCKHWEADWKPNNVQDGVHFCPMVSLVRRGDWFCANGERRDA